jgi:hypothetical protein
LLSLGYIRKIAWQVYFDPKYLAMKQYARLIGSQPLASHLAAPGYDVTIPADLSVCQKDVPYIDCVVCQKGANDGAYAGLHIAIVNLHLDRFMSIQISLPENLSVGVVSEEGEWTSFTHSDPVFQATPVHPKPFSLRRECLRRSGSEFHLRLSPYSLNWVWFSTTP